MNFYNKIISSFFIATLVLFNVTLVVTPVNEAQAQSGRKITISFCFNDKTKDAILPSSDGSNSCPSGSSIKTLPTLPGGYCVTKNSPYQVSSPLQNVTNATTGQVKDQNLGPYLITSNGQSCTSAPTASSPAITIYDFARFPTTTYSTTTGTGGSGTGTGGSTTGTGGGTGTSGGSRPGTGTGGSGTTSGNTQTKGSCATGFHQVGPLCVPNSGFAKDSLLGDTSPAGLAMKIIRLMLYFAGIVAVFMLIIGGYQVMTAGANPTQATNGRKTLTNALIGLIIVILSFAVVQVVINFVLK